MLSDLLIPLGVGSLIVLVAAAFALYAWTWYRHVAGGAFRPRAGRRRARPSPRRRSRAYSMPR